VVGIEAGDRTARLVLPAIVPYFFRIPEHAEFTAGPFGDPPLQVESVVRVGELGVWGRGGEVGGGGLVHKPITAQCVDAKEP